MSDIGTFSTRDSGKIYDLDNKLVDVEDGFIIKVNENTPHGYYCYFDIEISYKDGLNDSEEIFSYKTGIQLMVNKGEYIRGNISEDKKI